MKPFGGLPSGDVPDAFFTSDGSSADSLLSVRCSISGMTVGITHDRCVARFSAVDGDREVGYLTYSVDSGILDIEHTVVMPEMRGRGIAALLVDAALDFSRKEGLGIAASCSYAAAALAKK